MSDWYKKKSTKPGHIIGFCKKIYYRHDSIVASFYTTGSEKFYVVLFSTAPTTQVKHSINTGTYWKTGGKCIEIERIEVEMTPYIYRQK